jgi:hypothetical protein
MNLSRLSYSVAVSVFATVSTIVQLSDRIDRRFRAYAYHPSFLSSSRQNLLCRHGLASLAQYYCAIQNSAYASFYKILIPFQ